MQYRVIDKIVDSLIVFMLIMSAGGMLFVLNRNIASVFFLLFILFVLIFMENKWKKTIINSILLTFSILVVLGSINYFFVETEQTANKYLFHLLTVTLSVLALVHFKNNRTSQQLIRSLYVVLA